MSAFIALTNAVSGLQTQAQALETISGNIANSQTIGYKRIETGFADMVAASVEGQEHAGGATAFSRGTTSIAGAINATGVPTHFALRGDGFVVVRQPVDAGGAGTSFSPANLYTRRGDFALDENGCLVNGTGQALCGYGIDPVTGARSTATPDVIRTAVGLSPAKATTRVAYSANLPAQAQTASVTSGASGSDVWPWGAFSSSSPPAKVTPDAATGSASASFAAHSISGGSVTVYDSLGGSKDVELRWAKVSHDATTGGNGWALYYNATPGSAPAAATWSQIGTVTFGPRGTLVAPTTALTADFSAIGMPSAVGFDVTGGRLTQFDDPKGEAKVAASVQDGYAAGALQSLAIAEDGRVRASFSNGQSRDIAQIAVARFSAPDALAVAGSGTWRESIASGGPLMGSEGMSFVGGSLEASNTDVAQEFSKLIVAQQAYSANTRVMSTAQQMLQDVLNAVR